MRIKDNVFRAIIAMCFMLSLSQINFSQVTISVQPTQLYRFIIDNNLSVFMTPSYAEGISKGYVYAGVVGYAFVPPTGATVANTGLQPVHRWHVVQRGRIYYYYSQTYSNQGNGYTYEGVKFYMYNPAQDTINIQPPPLPPQILPLHKLMRCYSQSRGFWYGRITPSLGSLNPIIYTSDLPPSSGFDCYGLPNNLTNNAGGGPFTIRGTAPGSLIQVSEANPWSDDGAEWLVKENALNFSELFYLP